MPSNWSATDALPLRYRSHGESASLEGLLLIHRRDRGDVAPGHKAQCVHPRALARQGFGQHVLKGAGEIGARQLQIAMRVALELIGRHETFTSARLSAATHPPNRATMQRLWRSMSVSRRHERVRHGALRT